MTDLLSEESLTWCDIGAGLDFWRRELGSEPLTPNSSWTIYPGGGGGCSLLSVSFAPRVREVVVLLKGKNIVYS